MITIYFDYDWKMEYSEFKKLTPNKLGIWKNIKIVNKINKADFIIILQKKSKKNRIINKNKLLYFQMEPKYICKKIIYDVYKNFDYINGFHTLTNFVHLKNNYDNLSRLKYNHRINKLCAIISAKGKTYGHKLRKKFLIEFCKNNPTIIDVYGIGWNNNLNGCYKGTIDSKFSILHKYKYTLAFENCELENYFTEKITDPILSLCMPIYWGCSNINKYFPKNSYYFVNLKKYKKCEQQILNIINQEIIPININALLNAKHTILNNYNIMEVLYNLLN